MTHRHRLALSWLCTSFAAAGLAVAASVSAAPQQNPYPPEYQARGIISGRELAPDWTVAGVNVSAVSVAPDGSCIAVVTQAPAPGRITLIDRSGRRAWEMSPPALLAASAVGVAPGCSFVAFDATRESDQRPATGVFTGGRGRVGIRHRDGRSAEVATNGRPDSIAISHAGDLLAIGSECQEGQPNLVLASPDGRVVHASERFSYRAPQVVFSRDDRFVIVKGWYGVGVIARTGERVWGPWPVGGDLSKRTDWRTIDASSDLQWFAAEQGPMHGPQGGSFAMLSRAGEVVWQGPPVWDPDARIAPDGSFFAAVGREMRRGESLAGDGAPVRLAVMDRTGRVLASMTAPGLALECVSADGRFVIVREAERATGGWTLVGRDRALAQAWRVGRASGFAVHQESGLILSWNGAGISGYLVPR